MSDNSTPVIAIKQESGIDQDPVTNQEPAIDQKPAINQEPVFNQEPVIKQEPIIYQEPVIKPEPGIKAEPREHDNPVPSKTGNREILVDIGMSRRKIFHLNADKCLFVEFHKYVCLDPALSDLLIRAYPVFQTFNPKFRKWVDLDCEKEENLSDGAEVRVMFFPKVVATDHTRPGSIKRKREDIDSEPNSKHRRTQFENDENNMNWGNYYVKRNEAQNWNSRSRSNYRSPVKRKCVTPNYRSRDAGSIRRNFQCNSVDRRRSEWNSSARKAEISSARKRIQWPEENNTIAQVTPTKVQSQNIQQMEPTLLHPDFPIPSLTNERPTGAAGLPDKEKCGIRVRSIHLMREEMPVVRNMNQEVLGAAVQPLHVDERQHPKIIQNSAPVPKVYERAILWHYVPRPVRSTRVIWGQRNTEKIWWNTVFSDIAMFGLEGNRIKYFEKFDMSRKNCIIFWGLRSFDGPNIIASMGFSLASFTFGDVLKKKVVECLKNHYLSSEITLQILDTVKTQFQSIMLKSLLKINSINLSEWPSCTRDLSPVFHAWRAVAEKVKHIPCSSTEEMISIVSSVWESDVDVQLMCSNVITLLPQIIKSVVEREGSYPMVDAKYVLTT